MLGGRARAGAHAIWSGRTDRLTRQRASAPRGSLVRMNDCSSDVRVLYDFRRMRSTMMTRAHVVQPAAGCTDIRWLHVRSLNVLGCFQPSLVRCVLISQDTRKCDLSLQNNVRIINISLCQGETTVRVTSGQFVFDGPLGTLWTESMNAVLEESKKMCPQQWRDERSWAGGGYYYSYIRFCLHGTYADYARSHEER